MKLQKPIVLLAMLLMAGQLPAAVTTMFVGQVRVGERLSTRIGTLVELVAVQPEALPTRRVNPTLPALPGV